jgi:hypothetical protein
MAKSKPPRCNYCMRPSVVWISWTAATPRGEQSRALKMRAGACAEHETCVAFVAYRTLRHGAAEHRA